MFGAGQFFVGGCPMPCRVSSLYPLDVGSTDPRPPHAHSVVTTKVSPGVSIRLGSYNKVPQVQWLINNRRLVLTALEVGSPTSGVWRRSLPDCRLPISHCALAW